MCIYIYTHIYMYTYIYPCIDFSKARTHIQKLELSAKFVKLFLVTPAQRISLTYKFSLMVRMIYIP